MAPGGLFEVRVSWPGHPRYLKKKELAATKFSSFPSNSAPNREPRVLQFFFLLFSARFYEA